MYYNFDIYKKSDEYLAVIQTFTSQFERNHYFDQGYSFWGTSSASNADLAINLAKQQDSSTISTLKRQNEEQRLEIVRLANEVNTVKASQYQQKENAFDVDPLTVLGLDGAATQKDIKQRYRILAKDFHSDRVGSDFLMKLVNSAYDKLVRKSR